MKRKESFSKENYSVFMSRAEGSLQDGYRVQLLPAIFFTCFILLVSRMFQGPSAYAEMGDFFFMSDSTTTTDFYFYYKSIAVYICAFVALTFFGYRAVTGGLWVRKSRLYIPLAVYLVLVFLSFLFSDYRQIAWLGTDGLYGGAAVILCCGFMFLYIINSVSCERGVKWFLWPLTVCVLAVSVLGVTQALGRDFFRTVIGQKMLVPNIETLTGERAWDIIDSFAAQGKTALDFVFDTAVYQTVGNPNYVAMYTPLVLPLFGYLFLRESSLVKRVIWAAAFGLVLFNLFATQSNGAVVGAVVVLIVCVVLAGRRFLSEFKPKLVLVGIVIVCILLNFQTLLSGAAQNVLETVGADRAPSVIGEMAEGTVAASELEYYKRPAHSVHRIERIVTEIGRVEVTIDGESFTLTADSSYAPDSVRVTHEAQPDGGTTITMQVAAENRVWRFIETPDGYKFVNDFNKLVSLGDVDFVGNDENLFLGTGRVYIWSRTLPLLKNTVFLGHGPDTFMLYFPQGDYVGRYNGSWDFRAIFDKPHNMYLNIAFSTGILSLAAFLVLIILYLSQSFKIYRRWREESFKDPVGVVYVTGRGIAVGVCGFLAAGMFYDGVTSVMPLFWGLLGLGTVCNVLLSKATIVIYD